jgi:hypothetical protein
VTVISVMALAGRLRFTEPDSGSFGLASAKDEGQTVVYDEIGERYSRELADAMQQKLEWITPKYDPAEKIYHEW